MQCVICKVGVTHLGRATVTLERGQTIVVVREVPAEVCDNCGEYYLSEQVSEHILASAEDAAQKHAEVEILRYAA